MHAHNQHTHTHTNTHTHTRACCVLSLGGLWWYRSECFLWLELSGASFFGSSLQRKAAFLVLIVYPGWGRGGGGRRSPTFGFSNTDRQQEDRGGSVTETAAVWEQDASKWVEFLEEILTYWNSWDLFLHNLGELYFSHFVYQNVKQFFGPKAKCSVVFLLSIS